VTPDVVRAVMPNCKDPVGWGLCLIDTCTRFKISTPDRQAAFLAQIAHESLETTRLEENLRYTPDRLKAVWPKRFTTDALATKYANNSHGLADFIYANRMGNGDESSGEGWKFRGRGLIMATGKDWYRRLAAVLGAPLLDCPDMLCTKQYGSLSAGYIWASMDLNPLADDLPDDDDQADFFAISRRINGGKTGLDARVKYWKRARAALGLKEV